LLRPRRPPRSPLFPYTTLFRSRGLSALHLFEFFLERLKRLFFSRGHRIHRFSERADLTRADERSAVFSSAKLEPIGSAFEPLNGPHDGEREEHVEDEKKNGSCEERVKAHDRPALLALRLVGSKIL